MLELPNIRENKEKVIESLKKRNNLKNIEVIIDNILDLDSKRRNIKKNLDDCLYESNKMSKEIGILYKENNHEKINSLKEDTILIKNRIQSLEEDYKNVDLELNNLLYHLPNAPYDLVKSGKNSEENEIIYTKDISDLKRKEFHHWDLVEKLDIIDFKAGAKITGSGFLVYKGKGAVLQRAMINYFLDKNINVGYQEIIPPHLVNEDSGFGTGQLPDKEGQMYKINEDNLYLIPTAEVPVMNIFRDTLIQEKDLPIKPEITL